MYSHIETEVHGVLLNISGVCLIFFTACSRVCQNGGILDVGTCTCACADGYSGANCEGELISTNV